MHTEIFF